jgi:hypothetical protein
MHQPTLAFLAAAAWLALSAHAQPQHSDLWGKNGESWSASGRLPDVSFAGYACGEIPLPSPPVRANVRDFGAKGDGSNDDSAAFLAAIANTRSGAIFIPAGRYKITKILEINKPGIVLRGEGPEKTILVCPIPLNEIQPDWGATSSGIRTSNYSWSGGIVWFQGNNPRKWIARSTTAAKRGDREILLQSVPKGLSPGDWIEISLRDDSAKSLLDHLYSGDSGKLNSISHSNHTTSFVSRVTKIKGKVLTLERPLRTDLRPEWKPQISTFNPTVSHSGIEELAFEFPQRSYGGHFTELGFNAVSFNNVVHCWARNLSIINSDSGIFAAGRFCTITGIHLKLCENTQETRNVFGHHGVSLTGHDNLFTRFHIEQRFIHDITVTRGAGNVASAGRATDLSLDHHKRAPYDNVFTDIDSGAGSRIWKSGGGSDLGRNCGAHGTFWNIRATQALKHPGGFGPPSMNLVALQSNEPSITQANGIWFEAIDPARIDPPNLHDAQLARRTRSSMPSPAPR